MRARAAFLVFLLMLAAPACGDDNGGGETDAGSATVTETVTTPAPETTAPQAGAPEPIPTTPEGPAQGEVVVLRGAAGGAQTGPEFSSFMLVPDSGGEPVTIAAANDLELPIDVRRDLFDPRCEGKLQGGFTVEPARPGETEFQYALISVELTANAC